MVILVLTIIIPISIFVVIFPWWGAFRVELSRRTVLVRAGSHPFVKRVPGNDEGESGSGYRR